MKQAYRTSMAALVATLAFAAATPAIANDDRSIKPAVETAAAPKHADNPKQRVCLRDTPTGSRVVREYCKTRAEWAREGQVFAQR